MTLTDPYEDSMARYTVATPFGTFTRKTERTYTHVVVVRNRDGYGVLAWCGREDLAMSKFNFAVAFRRVTEEQSKSLDAAYRAGRVAEAKRIKKEAAGDRIYPHVIVYEVATGGVVAASEGR